MRLWPIAAATALGGCTRFCTAENRQDRRLQHRVPDHRGDGRRIPEGAQAQVKITVGFSGHRRRLQEIRRGRDRHLQRLAAHQAGGGGQVQGSRHQLRRAAGRLGRPGRDHHPENTWAKKLTVEQLKKIWSPDQGKTTKWSDVDPTWPEEEIKLYGAGSDSGTFDYFTEVINGKEKEIRTRLHAPARTTTPRCNGVSRNK